MKTILRRIVAQIIHVRAGYSARTVNDGACGCEFAVPKWLRK